MVNTVIDGLLSVTSVTTVQVCVQGMTSQESAEACDQDAGMSRTLAAVLSLPTQDSSSVEDETCRASSFWPPRSWTDSG